MFSCEYYVPFKKTYFEEHLRTAASEREALIFYQWNFEVYHRDVWKFLHFLQLIEGDIYAINIAHIVVVSGRFWM